MGRVRLAGVVQLEATSRKLNGANIKFARFKVSSHPFMNSWQSRFKPPLGLVTSGYGRVGDLHAVG